MSKPTAGDILHETQMTVQRHRSEIMNRESRIERPLSSENREELYLELAKESARLRTQLGMVRKSRTEYTEQILKLDGWETEAIMILDEIERIQEMYLPKKPTNLT
jgi:hypothetical protein